VACAAIQPVAAVSLAQQTPQPRPIEAALNLLYWPPDEIPNIVVVDQRPPAVSALAEGWVVRNSDGSARPTIYIAGWSKPYRDALANPLASRSHSVIRLAGVLAHERAHLRHGPDEESAYAAQLTTLVILQAPDVEISNVRRALESVKRRQRARH
jgi:hypothetical protein